MDMDNTIFWDRIFKLMKEKQISKEKLSADNNIPLNTILGWISKNRLPDAELVCRIASYLNTTVEYLITGKEPVIKDKSPELKAAIQSVLDNFI